MSAFEDGVIFLLNDAAHHKVLKVRYLYYAVTDGLQNRPWTHTLLRETAPFAPALFALFSHPVVGTDL